MERVAEGMSSLFPELSTSYSSFLNADDTADGTVTFTGFPEGFEYDRFFKLASSIDYWPSDMWFSVAWLFDAPTEVREDMEERYQRYKGAWQTSSYWRHSERAAAGLSGRMSLISEGGLLRTKDNEVKEFLGLKGTGYSIRTVTFRLHWNGGKGQPDWK